MIDGSHSQGIMDLPIRMPISHTVPFGVAPNEIVFGVVVLAGGHPSHFLDYFAHCSCRDCLVLGTCDALQPAVWPCPLFFIVSLINNNLTPFLSKLNKAYEAGGENTVRSAAGGDGGWGGGGGGRPTFFLAWPRRGIKIKHDTLNNR